MGNDIAIFLDLDNLVIGARDANLNFDINLIINEIKQRTGGRVVLRRAYSGNLRQDQKLMKEMAAAGFTMQSAVSLNNFGKNLIDMYLVVDTMDTLIDGQGYDTYVIVTGDRDFLPLIHTLRKRGKYVIGMGLKHTTSESLMGLCDEYIYYEDMLPVPPLTENEVESLLVKAVNGLLTGDERVRASVVKERMIELSGGQFGRLQYSDTSFSKFLGRHADIIALEKDGTTTYVRRTADNTTQLELYRRYRSALKKQKLRVVPPRTRLVLLKETIEILQQEADLEWHELVERLAARHPNDEQTSRNIINAMIVLARRAGVVRTLKGKTLSTAPVLLALEGPKAYQEGVIRCDMTYLEAIRDLPEPFDTTEVALAIYDQPGYAPYINQLVARLDAARPNGAA
ncbi:MAG: NYN domain-containing protein [Anaerolineae bacterium]|nr:NYN domain-containing protein [Anaerolineae bacterium]